MFRMHHVPELQSFFVILLLLAVLLLVNIPQSDCNSSSQSEPQSIEDANSTSADTANGFNSSPFFDHEKCMVRMQLDSGSNSFINLKPISNPIGRTPRYNTTATVDNEVWTYTYDPCYTYDMPINNSHSKQIYGDRCHSVLMCKYFYQANNNGHFYSLAVPLAENLEVEKSVIKGEPVYVLIYTGIKSLRNAKSKVALVCSPSVTGEAEFKIVSDVKSSVIAELRHKCCCPGACPEPVNEDKDKGQTLLVVVGTVLSIVLLVALIGGLCYVKRTQIQIYSKLPGLHPNSASAPAAGVHGRAIGGRKLSDFRDYEPASIAAARRKLLPVLVDITVSNREVEMGQRLGGGFFADTHLAKWREMTITIKRLTLSIHSGQLSPETVDMLKREVEYLSGQRHKNIVCVMALCVDGRLPYILTEYVIGECLKDYIKVNGHLLTWPQRTRMCSQVADGMAFLHSTKPPVLHRDLRCGNLFLSDNDDIKVADFGMVKLLQPLRDKCTADDCSCQRHLSGCPASIRWTAPEIIAHPRSVEGESSIISTAADVYSFGLLMWELVMCRDPFHEITSEKEVMEIVKNGGRPDIPHSHNMLSQFRHLMKTCWDQRQSHRPPFKEVAIKLKEMIGPARAHQKSLLNKQQPAEKAQDNGALPV